MRRHAAFGARHGREWRGHFGHCIGRHIDPLLNDNGVGDWLAGRLVLQAHRHDDILTLFQFRVDGLEHIVIRPRERGDVQRQYDGGTRKGVFP